MQSDADLFEKLSNFYAIKCARDGQWLELKFPDFDYFKDNNWSDILRGKNAPDDGISFVVEKEGNEGDLARAGLGGRFVISQRVVDGLTAEDATGWKVIPANIQGRTARYHFLCTTGRCGKLDPELSRYEVMATPSGRPRKMCIGRVFRYESWDGSDVFMPDGTRWVFFTSRIVEAFSKHKLTNMAFYRITEMVGLPDQKP